MTTPEKQYICLASASQTKEIDERNRREKKKSKQPPPAPTARAVGPCPTLLQIKGRRPSVPRRVKCQYVVNMSITCKLKNTIKDDKVPPNPDPPQIPSPDQTQHGPFLKARCT